MRSGHLPGGIVTFVFTDVEGSTRLLHRLGDRFADLLRSHRTLLRGIWSSHNGVVVSAEGDEFFVAFESADDAAAACVAVQRALRAAMWPDGVDVRVRAGIHSGLASPREGDYVALAVNQAKRVADAAHGGQILVSGDTAREVSPAWAPSLRCLGRFRLRGFPEPAALYQVTGEGLEVGFASVRAVPAGGHNIVLKPTRTIGREDVIEETAQSVVPGRTVTLVGPGGVGKSHLAAEVGVGVAPRWGDGVWIVELSGVGEPELVAAAVAGAVGAPAGTGRTRLDDVLDHLAPLDAVVLLDNCEHVVPACRDLVGRIHSGCPGIGIIATSREPLHVPGESIRAVEPLRSPQAPGAGPDEVMAAPACRLFGQRAAAVRDGFRIDQHNAGAVAEICRRVDGLPLLIELAAAHVSALSPAEILAGLADRFRLLRSPDREMPERHRTVEGLLEWSYRLLSAAEQSVLRRLSVFGAGFSKDVAAAAGSGAGIEPADVYPLVWSLVDRSLVDADVSGHGARYRLLETVRGYARRLLDERGETGPTALRVADAFLGHIGPWLPVDRDWVDEMEAEVGNLRALIPILAEAHQEVAQQIVCSIGWYHDAGQTFRDGIDEMRRLAASLPEPTPSRVAMLTTLSWLLLRTGNLDHAGASTDTAAVLRDECGAPEWDDVGIERIRGEIARRSGDLYGAIEIARRTLQGRLSDRGRARMCNLLGTTSADAGDLETAYEACRTELRLYQELGYEGMEAGAHGNLAEVALRLADMPRAALHQRDCLRLAVAQGSPAMLALSLIAAARIAGWLGDWRTATSLHARAEALVGEIGLVLYDDDRRRSEELLIEARGRLGREQFAETHSGGRAMPIADAVGIAEEVLAAP